MSNGDVGGKIFEVGSTEYYVRARYIKNIADIEISHSVAERHSGVCKECGAVHLGPDLPAWSCRTQCEGRSSRRHRVMRYGENALTVIDGIKKKLEEIKIVPARRR